MEAVNRMGPKLEGFGPSELAARVARSTVDVGGDFDPSRVEAVIDARLVRCPETPCDEKCIWCCGSGWIAKSTLRIWQMKRAIGGHDTDPMTQQVAQ